MDGEKENLRAKNIIWTAAGDYTFRPQFLAENGNETLDLYLNMVIGLVHKWYDTDKVAAYFDSLGGTEHQGACDALSWVALENAVYEREIKERPVLSDLREEYAEEILSRTAMLVKTLPEERINEAKCRRILGKREVPRMRKSCCVICLRRRTRIPIRCSFGSIRRFARITIWTYRRKEETGEFT